MHNIHGCCELFSHLFIRFLIYVSFSFLSVILCLYIDVSQTESETGGETEKMQKDGMRSLRAKDSRINGTTENI